MTVQQVLVSECAEWAAAPVAYSPTQPHTAAYNHKQPHIAAHSRVQPSLQVRPGLLHSLINATLGAASANDIHLRVTPHEVSLHEVSLHEVSLHEVSLHEATMQEPQSFINEQYAEW